MTTDRDTTLTGSLGTYRLRDLLSVGGMAEVYRATRLGAEGFERAVAIKRILPQFAQDAHFMAMFIDEAKIAARLDHPNIVKTLDLGLSDGTYFLAMEYVPSFDLRALLGWCHKAGVKLPIAHTCRIVADVCDALAYLHSQRDGKKSLELVHRDISPSNVLISTNGTVKLIDFGVAKTSSARALTDDGTVKGKIPYLAPERLFGGGDHRADIFGAGVLLWELLCAERLFPGQDDREIIRRIRKGVTPPASTRNHLVPPALDDVLAKALALDPDDRYQDASEMYDDLRRIARTMGEDYSERALVAWVEQRTLGDLMPSEDPPTTVSAVSEPLGKRRRATSAAGTSEPPVRSATAATLPARGARHAPTVLDDPPSGMSRPATDGAPALAEGSRRTSSVIGDIGVVDADTAARVTFRPPTNAGDATARPRASSDPGTGRARTNGHIVRRMARGTPHLPMPAANDGDVHDDPSAVEVRVYSEPPGAEVTIEMPGRQRELGVTPVCAWLDRGSAYLLTVRHPGHEEWSTRLVFHEGSTCAVSALLRPSESKAQFKETIEPLPGAYFFERRR